MRVKSIFLITMITLLMSANMCTSRDDKGPDVDFRLDCRVHNYDGGPGQVIAAFSPTLPGKVSLDSSSNALDITSNVVSNVPVVGGALGSLFGIIGIATDSTVNNMQILASAINTLTDDIRKTVNDLKNYVDAKFMEYDYDQKSEKLNGLLYHAGVCASFNKPSNLEDCLKDLNFRIIDLVPVFFPADEKYETYEQLLPLTRHYIDLQMAVLIDIVNITNFDSDYVKSIATFSVMAYNFYVTSIETIVQQHNVSNVIRQQNMSSLQHLPWYYSVNLHDGKWPFEECVLFDSMMLTMEWDHKDGCRVYLPDFRTQRHDRPCIGDECFDCRDIIMMESWLYNDLSQTWEYIYWPLLSETIRRYWEADMGTAMENYKKIGIMACANEDDYLVMGSSFTAEAYVPTLMKLTKELQYNSRKYLDKKIKPDQYQKQKYLSQ